MPHLSPSDCVFQRSDDTTGDSGVMCSGAGYPIKNILLSLGVAPMETCNTGATSHVGRVSDLFAGSVGVPLGLVALESKSTAAPDCNPSRDTDCQLIPESLFASLVEMVGPGGRGRRHTRRKPTSRAARRTRRA